jgi:hypothetical protein
MSQRKSDTFAAIDDYDLDAELENMPITDSCDTVRYILPTHLHSILAQSPLLTTILTQKLTSTRRRRIHALIDSGEMKAGEFQAAIKTSSKVYSSFMTQDGPYNGSGSSVYYSAWAFFKKRELQRTNIDKKAEFAAAVGPKSQVDVSHFVLDEEEIDDVEVYGTYSYLWWLFCAWGTLALATDSVWDFDFY